MVKNNKYRDLCSTCKHAADCTFPKDRQSPSLYCEEFEIDLYPSAKTTGKEKSMATALIDSEDEDTGKFIGLCVNCDNRKKCAFSVPEGGIWHCEEYQ